MKSARNAMKMKHFWLVVALIVIFISISMYYIFAVLLKKPSYVENKEFTESEKGVIPADAVDIYFFHTSWCPHCKTAFPVWNELKTDTPTVKGIKINYIEVDCENDTVTAEKYQVTGYPTIKLVHGNSVIEYDAKPDLKTLQRFIETSV